MPVMNLTDFEAALVEEYRDFAAKRDALLAATKNREAAERTHETSREDTRRAWESFRSLIPGGRDG